MKSPLSTIEGRLATTRSLVDKNNLGTSKLITIKEAYDGDYERERVEKINERVRAQGVIKEKVNNFINIL